jgi:hypothetical protein
MLRVVLTAGKWVLVAVCTLPSVVGNFGLQLKEKLVVDIILIR